MLNSELKELYQEVILDHNKSPRNFKKLESSNRSAQGYNHLCGDKIDVFLDVENEIVKDISFLGSGCAISKASASLMTEALKDKPIDEAKELFENFHAMITGKLDEEENLEELGKLAVFAGVKEFPIRVKCASLAWHTMISALKNGTTVSTE